MMSLLLAVIYLSFISLGLPDSLLGSAWPLMYQELQVPVSYAGGISMIISAGTIFSSLQSDRLTKKFGPGAVTAASVAMTAAALFGFSISRSFGLLCFWAVPYGLGAGSVDAALNNFVALHYSSRHMSWLHCMWGVGATVGPYIMGYALSGGLGWQSGYRVIGLIQIGLTAVLIFSLPLWKKMGRSISLSRQMAVDSLPLSPRQVLRLPGAREAFGCFFAYCALEQTAGLWGSSYLVLHGNMSADRAAGFAALFYLGITVGRALNGFLAIRYEDDTLIRMGEGILAVGVLLLLIPGGMWLPVAGLILVGLGCAPIYPSIVHSTPRHFGPEKSQAVIGVQMACAYIGSLSMPPLFGLLANHIGVFLFPYYLLVLLVFMAMLHKKLCGREAK